MIELLVVATIMIVLTAVGLVSYTQVNQRARNSKRQADMETVRQALVLYRSDAGTYPPTSDFSTLKSTLSTYLRSDINDPKNETPYLYAYESTGATFTLTAVLEPDAVPYQLLSP